MENNTIFQWQTRINGGDHYPSKDMLEVIAKRFQDPVTRREVRPGFVARTDGFDVDQIVTDLEDGPEQVGLLSGLSSASPN